MEKKHIIKAKIEKPFITFPVHTKEFMNKVNERASATHSKYVGVIDELFYLYYLDCIDNGIEMSIETWKSFHVGRVNTDAGKKALKNKLKEMKSAIASITEDMIDKWYDFFLFNQTFYGKHQEFLIKEYFESIGLNVEMRRPVIGENKIDMLVENLNIQVKPLKSRNPSRNRPQYDDVVYIYYEKKGENITFFWDSELLDKLINEREKVNENQN